MLGDGDMFRTVGRYFWGVCYFFLSLLALAFFGLYVSSNLVVTAQAPPLDGPSDDFSAVYQDAETALAAAYNFEAAGEVDRAFASYLTVLDSALAAGDELSISADANLDTLVDKVADNILSEAEADEIEADLPAWDDVDTPRAKNWLMRFADARRLRYASEGKYQEAYQATLDVRDMAWDIVNQSPNDPSVRKAIQVYYDTNQALGQREKAAQDLAGLAQNLPPTVASRTSDLTGSVKSANATSDEELLIAANSAAQVKLTIVEEGNGQVEPDGGVYNPGTEVTLTATPSYHARFTGWTGDLTSSENPVTVFLSSDFEATAHFVNSWEVIESVWGQGRVTPVGLFDEGTLVTIQAVPAQDWEFAGWDGELFGKGDTVEVTMTSDVVAAAQFVYRPGVGAMDLVADLGGYLVEIGVNQTAGQVKNLAFDMGELDNSGEPVGNEVPDAAELLVLQGLLQRADFNRTAFGGTGSSFVWEPWTVNLAQAQTDLPTASAAFQRITAAYMTLGSEGHQKFVAAQAYALYTVELDLDDYSSNAMTDLDVDGNPDADGAWNRLEWKTLLAYLPGAPTFADAVTYAEMALDPKSPAAADINYARDAPGRR